MKNLGVYAGGFFLLIAGIILWQSTSMSFYSEYGPGPGMLPCVISISLIILSLLYLFVVSKKDVHLISKVLPKGTELKNVLLAIGACVLFIVAVPYTGFLVGSMVMLCMLLKRSYSWLWTIGISLVVTILVYLLFGVFLAVSLPVNIFGW